jgi:hypothetical protein
MIIRGLRAAGKRVIIVTGPIKVTPGSQARLDALQNGSDGFYLLPKIGNIPSLASCLTKVSHIIRQENVDVVCPQGFKMLPFAKLLSIISGKPSVGIFHGGAASHV